PAGCSRRLRPACASTGSNVSGLRPAVTRNLQLDSTGVGSSGQQPMILLGELSLWIALLMTGWAATVSFAGGRLCRPDLVASGERAVYASTLFVVLASAGLLTALITH